MLQLEHAAVYPITDIQLSDEKMMKKRGGLSPYCPKVQGTRWVHVLGGYLLASRDAFLMELL
jgi:hypothetical protein